MSNQDPIIVLGLTGEVDTIRDHVEALSGAGLTQLRYAEAKPGMSALEKHNALVDLAHAIRAEQPTARFLVFEESLRPWPGAKSIPEGTLSFGSAVKRSVEELKSAAAQVRAFELAAAPAAKPISLAQSILSDGIFPPDSTLASHHWSPFEEAKRQKKKPEPAVKPKLLALYYQPCNGEGIVKNPKAEITHVMVVPKDLQHSEFLTTDTQPLLDRKKLGALQARTHGKPTFLKAMSAQFGENFWSNKKYDTAIATAEELQALVQRGGYDGVVVIGDADRQHYALLPQNVETVIRDMNIDKAPLVRGVVGSQDLVNDARTALGAMVEECKKAAKISSDAGVIVTQALKKAATDDAPKAPRIRTRQMSQIPASRALRPTRPAPARCRSKNEHALVIYGPEISDPNINFSGTNVEIDKVILADASETGSFVNPDGGIQKSALASRENPLSFVADARARFGDGFHRSVRGVFSTVDQLTGYLAKRRPHGSARETRAYDQIVLVGNVPEGFSITVDAIQEACASHKNNKGEPCVFSHVSNIEELRERFPVQTVESALGMS